MADDPVLAHELLPPALPVPFAAALTAGPYNFECGDDENLRLTSFNSQAGVTIRIVGRIKRRDGTIADIDISQTATTDRAAKAGDYPLGAGYLLNLSVFAASGSPSIGQTFVRVQLIRGRTGATMPIGTLVQGYITGSQDRAWPGSPIEDSISGGGYERLIFGTDPAAGAEVSETVPTGARWELISFYVQLVCDATVATRRGGIAFDNGATAYYRSPQPGTIAASGTMDLYWAQGSPFETAVLTDVSIGNITEANRLLAGHRIFTATNNLKAGDNLGVPRYLVREWLEAP